eukprot:g39384.t1
MEKHSRSDSIRGAGKSVFRAKTLRQEGRRSPEINRWRQPRMDKSTVEREVEGVIKTDGNRRIGKERTAFRSLRSNANLSIKHASSVTNRLLRHGGQLSDTSSYYPPDHDPTSDHQAIISQTINNLITSGDL